MTGCVDMPVRRAPGACPVDELLDFMSRVVLHILPSAHSMLRVTSMYCY